MDDYNFKKVEKKWQKKWEVDKVFEADVDKREKFFCSHPYAYPSGDLHIGHARTFTRGDIIARFKRMQKFNTLFPMGFHLTGNRSIILAKRVKEKDPKTLKILKNLYKENDGYFTVREIKLYLDAHPEVYRLNSDIIRNEGLLKSLRNDRRHEPLSKDN